MLRIKDLSIFYGKVEAVKGISMEVTEGSIVALIGSNGAGKSSTLRAVSGIITPTRGEIWYLGERIDKLAPERIVMRGIAQAPEGRMLFPYMTVMDTLRVGSYTVKSRSEFNSNLERVFYHFPKLKERRKRESR